jgi:rod shape-determining protein MreC
MAPPSPRRPGFSRRAQYGLFASYVIAVLGALFGLLLLITARLDPKGHSVLQGAANDITAPISGFFRSAGATLSGASDEVSAYFNAATKNAEMARELKTARSKLIQGQKDALEVARLKKLLGVLEGQARPVAIARLVNSPSASSRRYATLAAGSANGVEAGQPVRAADGLIGRVEQTGTGTARVLLIIDAGNTVPVKRASDGLAALANGLGDGRMEVRPLAAGSNPFKIGDVFISSGTGGIYAPGIPVARAIQKSGDRMIALPTADPATFDFAIVETAFVVPLPIAKDTEAKKPDAKAAK